MGEWVDIVLRDICDSVDYGLTASASDDADGPRFLRITDIVNGSLDWNRVPHVKASPAQREKYKLNHGDIVIARTGATTGRSKWIKDPPEAVFASYLVRLKINPQFDSRFVGYLLSSNAFMQYVRGVLGDKSAQPNASATTLTSATLRVPSSRVEQQAIAAVLGALDDKIAVNERIASTSDELIRQQYLQMVGDVEDSVTLGELGYLVRESVSATDLRASDNYIALEHMPRRNMWLAEWESAESVVSTKTRFIDGDVLFGKLRPYFHKVGLALTEGVCSTDILVVRPVSNYLRGWLLASLSSDDVVAHASAVGDGTRMPRAKWSDLARYDVPWVGDDRASSFNDFVTSISCQVASILAENRTLTQLRDTLLPKLMSGQLRVCDAERMVEDAT